MDHSEQTRQLEHARIRVLLLKYSAPAILGTVVNATYNIVDRIFIGQTIGDIGLTAATLSFPAMMIFNGFAMMVGIGSSVLISIKLGEKNNEDAEKILGQALFLFFSISVIFGGLGLYFLEPILYSFSATEAAMPLAKEFLGIILLGVFFQTISFGVNSFIRAEGQPRIAMITMIMSAIVNTFLAWLFLCVFRTGIWGAALATVLAQAFCSVWIIALYLSGRTLLKIRPHFIRLNMPLARRIFMLGLPAFMMQLVGSVLQILQNHQLRYYGELYGKLHGFERGADISIAVMGILFSVFMLFLMPLLGIGQGMQPIVGYNIGANKMDRVARTLTLGLFGGFAFSVVCLGIISFFPDTFMSLFIKSDSPDRVEIIALGTRALRLCMLMLPGVGIVVILTNYFQSSGRPGWSLLLTFVRQVFILVPLLLVLPILLNKTEGFSGLDGIWLAVPISDFGALVLAVIFLVIEYRRLYSRQR